MLFNEKSIPYSRPMRLPVSLLVLCAGITGCTTSIDPALLDTISVSSNPPSAAVRLNGVAVGRTPTTVTLDRNSNYELTVGKGGFAPEVTYLKPTLRTNDNGSLDFGFPSKVNVTLTKLPTAGEVSIPEGDEAEFKGLVKKANGETVETSGSLKSDIAAVIDASQKVKAALATREVAAKTKLEAISKALDEARSAAAKDTDASSEAKITEAEANLRAALAERDSGAATEAATTLAKLEQRRANLEAKIETANANELAQQVAAAKNEVAAAFAASDAKVAKAQAELTTARSNASNGKSAAERVTELEAQFNTEKAALVTAQQNSQDVLKALTSRNEELSQLANNGVNAAKADAAKQLASIQQALEEQKVAVGKAIQERDDVKAANDKALAAAKADADKALAAANANADKALANAKDEADKKAAELSKQLDQAKADSKAEAAAAAEKALAEANAKLMEANEKLATIEQVLFATKASAEKSLGELQADMAKQIAAAKADADKALADTKAGAEKSLGELQADVAKQVATAKADADKASAEAKDAADKAITATQKALNDAKETAAAEKAADKAATEKALADARLDAEAKLAEVTKEAKEAIAESKRRVYAERNTRVALLELRVRTKAISEDEYKAQLAELRKEFAQ